MIAGDESAVVVAPDRVSYDDDLEGQCELLHAKLMPVSDMEGPSRSTGNSTHNSLPVHSICFLQSSDISSLAPTQHAQTGEQPVNVCEEARRSSCALSRLFCTSVNHSVQLEVHSTLGGGHMVPQMVLESVLGAAKA